MNRLLTILIVLNSSPFFSQNVELNAGANYNQFFHFATNEGHDYASYGSDFGYNIGIGINELRPDTILNFRFTLNYINYGGGFNVSGGGMGSGYTNRATVNKSIISVGIYPVNLKILKRIDFNLGLEFAHLVFEKVDGTASGWSMGQGNWTSDINDKFDRLSAKTYAGLSARIAWPIQLNNQLSIVPHYSAYFSLSNEFDNGAYGVKSFRNYFSIGIQRKLSAFRK